MKINREAQQAVAPPMDTLVTREHKLIRAAARAQEASGDPQGTETAKAMLHALDVINGVERRERVSASRAEMIRYFIRSERRRCAMIVREKLALVGGDLLAEPILDAFEDGTMPEGFSGPPAP